MSATGSRTPCKGERQSGQSMSVESKSDLSCWQVLGEAIFLQVFSWGAGLIAKVELRGKGNRAAGNRVGHISSGAAANPTKHSLCWIIRRLLL